MNRFVWIGIAAVAVGWLAMRGGHDLGDCISHGEQVDLEAHLAPQGLTLVEFTAEW